MQWPRFLKFRLPKWDFHFSLPKFFQSKLSFYSAWKRFARQVPPESRSIIKSYQHFIVLGSEKSGKTELIQGLIEQSQDLYPFDTSFTESKDIQFYLGPRHVVQELSFASLENRTIKIRKQVIRLWKKLYARCNPIVVISYDLTSALQRDLREMNKLAQFIAGKISLLTEITKRPLKTRIVLTSLDKVPGYLEFARFLKQQNINYFIPLTSNFESNSLTHHLKRFSEEYLSLILTTVSPDDYLKILAFFKAMPQIFPAIEEFLRALITRVSFKEAIEVDMLSLASNQESSTSFSPFQWTQHPSTTLFFRYPLLKHQLASVGIFTVSLSLLLNSYSHARHELLQIRQGVELLDLLQFAAFQEKAVPQLELLNQKHSDIFSRLLTSHFFEHKLKKTKYQIAHRIRKHIIDAEFRKTILENKGEIKYLYFLGLMRATASNNMGKFILKNSQQWAKGLHLKESLLKLYVQYCLEMPSTTLLNENKANPSLPLTSLNPWFVYLKKFQEIKEQPIFIEQNYDEIIKETDKLLTAIGKLRNDPLIFGIATLLDEGGLKDNENIQTIHWIGENVDALENFLRFINQTAVPPMNIQGMNLSQFFLELKKIALLAEAEKEVYHFTLEDTLFAFDSSTWANQVVAHSIEKTLRDYITLNTDSEGTVFFKNTPETPAPSLAHFKNASSLFEIPSISPGRYLRIDYESKVRSIVEKTVLFLDSLNISSEEKKRFVNYLARESINYIKKFQNKYKNYFISYNFKAKSLMDLKRLFTDLAKSSSDFYEFLRILQHQTSGFSEPFLAVRNIENINEFAFLNEILTARDGKEPIEGYQQIMGQILHELEAEPLKVLSPEKDAFLFQITPLAKMSLDILQNAPSSYMRRTQDYLNQIKMPEHFLDIFTKPIILLHKIGIEELKNSLTQFWQTQIQSQLDSISFKFPFNFNGSSVATVEEVEAIFHPRSKFYQAVSQVISFSCLQKEGLWIPREDVHLAVGNQIQEQCNWISKISRTLWDNEGKPKPLGIKIRPISFPGKEIAKTRALPVLSYLVAGDQSIYNFNQDPSWHSLSIEWWKEDPSFVGIELQNKETNGKLYQNIQAPASSWSFFSLLKQGQEENLVWSWDLPLRPHQDTLKISFGFEMNPYHFFKREVTQ
jgi:hypothetical protein